MGGRPIGLILTDNAQERPYPKWRVLDNDGYFVQEKVKFISAYLHGRLVLALAYESPSRCNSVGVWRSSDRGNTWKLVLKGVGRALAADPRDPKRFYATLDHTQTCNPSLPKKDGVVTFTSIDDGETWTPTKSQSKSENPLKQGDLINAKLSVSADGSRVWSGLGEAVGFGNLYSIFYSDDHGTVWREMDQIKIPSKAKVADCDVCTQMYHGVCDNDEKLCSYTAVGLNPGTQGNIHFSFVASPNDKNIIYAGGDRQPEDITYSYIGATRYSGYLFRGDSSITFDETDVPSPQWAQMTNKDTISAKIGRAHV